jgi:hypothetical protein
MTDGRSHDTDLEAAGSEMAQVAQLLREERPYPPPGLRSQVQAALPRRPPIGRPQRLWLRIALLAIAGAALLLLVAAGLDGHGPFAV